MNGKGDKRRPMTVQQELFASNWDQTFGKKDNMLREVNYDGMWQHSCTVEMAVMWVGKGEECNWCGETESD